VLKYLLRYPILVTAGGGLLGWIAGDIMSTDPAVLGWSPVDPDTLHMVAKPLFAALVVMVGTYLSRRAAARTKPVVDLAEGGGQ
jgi:hypothetical protein